MTLRLTPYLIMNGDAKDAIQFYERTLGAEVLSIRTYGEMPESPEFPLPDGTRERVAHALLSVGETDIMLSDTYPGLLHEKGNHIAICISTKTVEKSRQLYEALQKDGLVNNRLEETSFSPAFGSVTDKFGVSFTIVTNAEN